MKAPDMPDAIPAATLVILRDHPDDGAPELLMVQRAAVMSFAPGAIVFPGGRVDEADRMFAARLPHALDPEDAAARIAAIRETIEEVGIAIGLSPEPSPGLMANIRHALDAGLPFADIVGSHDLTIDLDALTPFSRWCPGEAERENVTRIFDTRFYVADAPDHARFATVDGTEIVRLRWATAADVIADCDLGREFAIFPTRRNLERLALGKDRDEIFRHARSFRADTLIAPWIEVRDGDPHLCIPDTLGYPVTAQPIAAIRYEPPPGDEANSTRR